MLIYACGKMPMGFPNVTNSTARIRRLIYNTDIQLIKRYMTYSYAYKSEIFTPQKPQITNGFLSITEQISIVVFFQHSVFSQVSNCFSFLTVYSIEYRFDRFRNKYQMHKRLQRKNKIIFWRE